MKPVLSAENMLQSKSYVINESFASIDLTRLYSLNMHINLEPACLGQSFQEPIQSNCLRSARAVTQTLGEFLRQGADKNSSNSYLR